MTPPVGSPWLNRGLVLAILLLLFATGIATGYGITLWSWTPKAAPPERPFQGHHYYSSLGLTVEQEKAVFAIYQKYRPGLEAVLQETRPRVRIIHEQIEQEIRALLTPEQVKQLEEQKARRTNGMHGMSMGAGFCPMEGSCPQGPGGCSMNGGGCLEHISP